MIGQPGTMEETHIQTVIRDREVRDIEERETDLERRNEFLHRLALLSRELGIMILGTDLEVLFMESEDFTLYYEADHYNQVTLRGVL